jgi:hypothetical protein
VLDAVNVDAQSETLARMACWPDDRRKFGSKSLKQNEVTAARRQPRPHSSESVMARETRLKRLFPVALNLDASAAALQCSVALLREAVMTGELVCYVNPKTGAKRIIIEDLILWVRHTWKPGKLRSES